MSKTKTYIKVIKSFIGGDFKCPKCTLPIEVEDTDDIPPHRTTILCKCPRCSKEITIDVSTFTDRIFDVQ